MLGINGFDTQRLSRGFAERVHAVWPRHDLGYAIAVDARANPMTAPLFSFPAHLDHLINGRPSPTFLDLVSNSAWGDQPLQSRIIANR
ncbi:hypothetical protein MSAR_30040 [Mycolicibacterium sarraceniae]|uniref:Uncharacterized protein n=1 Tax=Mycolicibacterium sarraceniae TaxID=1534348 RepID=A0A7I7SSS8_9MYCO|nr:hypothetical protein MSAR_30040 [Mycolicibacterium sarraceniae]